MIYRKTEGVVKREVAGEAFLVPVKDNLADMRRMFVLHGTGGFVWDQFDGARDMDAVCSQIVAEYDVERERAATDLAAIVVELKNAGLIREVQ